MSLTNEDLQAIAQLLQPIQSDVQNMKADVQNMKVDVQNMKADVQNMKADIQNMKADIQEVKGRVENVEKDVQNVERHLTGVELMLENETNHNIQLLAENHINLIDKLNQAIKVADKTLMYEVQLSSVKFRVDSLEKEMAKVKKEIAL